MGGKKKNHLHSNSVDAWSEIYNVSDTNLANRSLYDTNGIVGYDTDTIGIFEPRGEIISKGMVQTLPTVKFSFFLK